MKMIEIADCRWLTA